VLQAHEIVNDTVGERRIVVTYCEVCGAAMAWFADDRSAAGGGEVGTLDFRSSGLLLRGAPLAYDEATASLFDPYQGLALTGEMAEAGMALDPLAIATTTWEAWSDEHPETSTVSEDGGVGRIYVDEPRADPPMVWPMGERDDRVDSTATVLGVHTEDGTTVAFPVDAARRALTDDGELTWEGISIALDGGGLSARDEGTGDPLPSHESYWFAWSQFHPDTGVWDPGS
jgi:hypothetical protein